VITRRIVSYRTKKKKNYHCGDGTYVSLRLSLFPCTSKFEIKKKKKNFAHKESTRTACFMLRGQDVNRKQPSNVYTVYLGRRRLTWPLSGDEIRLSVCKHLSVRPIAARQIYARRLTIYIILLACR